jgi:glycerophosphoryl diester phosphodiesterase
MHAATSDVATIIPRMPLEIVAHRGDVEHFPENSLPAIDAAWRRGLRHVEFDVQVSADGVPFLLHDATIDRTTGGTGDARLMAADALERAGLPRLDAAATLMQGFPAARAFVEVKRASLAHHGMTHCMDAIIAALGPVLERCILISFDAEACSYARRVARMPIGWVLDAEPAALRPRLESMKPEFAFCDHARLAPGALPAGPWSWVIYEVVEPVLAIELHGRGASMVESMAPFRLADGLAAQARARA